MPGTKFSYGNKIPGIKGLRTKILAPALTSHYEVKIPVEQLSGNAKGEFEYWIQSWERMVRKI